MITFIVHTLMDIVLLCHLLFWGKKGTTTNVFTYYNYPKYELVKMFSNWNLRFLILPTPRNDGQTGFLGRRKDGQRLFSGPQESIEQEGVRCFNSDVHTAIMDIKCSIFYLFVAFSQKVKDFIVTLIAPMPRENTRTRNLALEARRVERSGIPRRASTMFPVSEPKWPMQRVAKEGRKAKEENKMWVLADAEINNQKNSVPCTVGEKLNFLFPHFVPLVFQKRPGKSVRKKMKARS